MNNAPELGPQQANQAARRYGLNQGYRTYDIQQQVTNQVDRRVDAEARMAAEPAGGFFGGMTTAIDKLVAAANSGGGFTVSDEGGQALINAIDTYVGKLDKHLLQAHHLSQELPLGSSPAANVFKPFLATIASDPAQGAVPAMKNLRQQLEAAKAAIQKSMASYQQAEQQNSTNIKSQGIQT